GVAVEPPQTNIVFADVPAGLLDHLKSRGVLATGALYGARQRLRFATHLDVDAEGIDRTVAAIRDYLND
ncbi:MAG TPA: low-specificity L-threonine aldolase, partial [Caldimonas sp.]|nr:low-specificity L-threonine aldolase [Caldimonas sp.]